ncbi:unnamed protein product [Trichobilharzia szidati]|nr:unnamed protein product [Trichobilharzia szidati]
MKTIRYYENVSGYMKEYFVLHFFIHLSITLSCVLGRISRLQEYSNEFSIDENCPIGTEVGTISAIVIPNPKSSSSLLSSQSQMKHSNENEIGQLVGLTYKLGSPSALFNIHERKGLLTTKAEIDAEALCYQVVKLNTEQMEDSDTSVIDLESGGLKNNRSKIATAVDQIKCNSSGDLTVQLDVNAIQADGSLRSVHHITIRIHDLNDNGPKFEQIRWHKRLKEALYRAGRKIDLPRARDIDLLAEHRRMNYRLDPLHEEGHNSINPAKSPFKLEISNLGQPRLVLTEDLDAEVETRHRFVLVAYSPNPVVSRNTLNNPIIPKESYLEIDIEVTDMNDNEPRFSSPVYNVSVAENASVGSVIFELVAYDPDSTSQLTYTMASSLEYHVMSTTFHIESDGHVRLRSSLDYELRQIYSIPIEVTDGEFSSRTTLNVQVLDVNDEPPAFELNPKQLVADENSLPGKLIGQVRIRDPDSPSVNGLVECSEPPGLVRRQALQFSPDPTVNPTAQGYDLTTRIMLDREDPENPIPGHLIIHLICSDGGSNTGRIGSHNSVSGVRLTSTMTVTLTIRDMNDHGPVFENSVYHVSIQENNQIGEKVVQISAQDDDEGENARITYSLLDRANFKIDALTGWITPNLMFDRETRDSYQVTAIATDHGKPRLSSSVLINITVLDVNDHSPLLASYETDESLLQTNDLPVGRFGMKNMFIIQENMPANTYVGDILAFDKDEGLNAELKFDLLPDPVFHLHERFKLLTNGSLYTNVELDREEKDHYRLTVVVSDKSPDEPLSTTGTIGIIVLDVNDNRPQLLKPQGLLSPNNSQLREYRRHMNPGVLLYDQPSEEVNHNIIKGNQKRSDPEYYTPIPSPGIIPEAENAKFTLPEPVIHLSVHEKPGQVICALYAEDPDAGENGSVFYLLEEFYDLLINEIKPNPLIRVNPENGDLVVLRQMLPTDLGYHFFKVTASDRGHPKMKMDQKILSILVEDIPASGAMAHNLLSSSYYMSNITGLELASWTVGGTKNILVISVLSVVSAILATILITAIICVIKPCSKNRRRHRNVNGRNDTLRDRPPTYPGSSETNGILMNESETFINGRMEQRGYTTSTDIYHPLFHRPLDPLNGHFDNWRHQYGNNEISCGNISYSHGTLPSADLEHSNSKDHDILINPRHMINTDNNKMIHNGTLQTNYENLIHHNLHDMHTSLESTSVSISPSSRMNDQSVSVRVFNSQIGSDGMSEMNDQISLPRPNKLSGIVYSSNSVTPKLDTANEFYIAKPIPLVSRVICNFNADQMGSEETTKTDDAHTTNSMKSTLSPVNLLDPVADDSLTRYQGSRVDTAVPKFGTFKSCMTIGEGQNSVVEEIVTGEEQTCDSGRGGSEEELILRKLDEQQTHSSIPEISCETGTNVWNKSSFHLDSSPNSLVVNSDDMNLVNPWSMKKTHSMKSEYHQNNNYHRLYLSTS